MSGAPDDYEHVALDYVQNELGAESMSGVDEGGEAGPCGCGDNYQCLEAWAEEHFRCGVCVSVACTERRLDVCTELCQPESLHETSGPLEAAQ